MREILYRGVAIPATKNGVGTGSMLRRVDVNLFALVRFHPLRAVACQAGFLLFLGMGIWYCGSASGSEHPRQRDQQAAKNPVAALPRRSVGAHKALPPGPMGP